MTEYPQATTAIYTPQRETEGAPLTEKASDVADAAKQAGADVAQTATEKAKDVAQETGKQARDLMDEAREQVRQQAGAQHRSLVTNLRSLGDELNGMTSGGGQSGVATEAVSQVRDRVNGAADWLERREPGDLIDELRRFARRRPGAFLVGALAAGVVAGRLTRGVVAVHADDSGATSKPALAAPNGTQPAFAPAEDSPRDPYPAEYSGYAAPSGNGEAGYGAAPAYGRAPAYGTPAYGTPANGTAPAYSPPPAYGTPPVDGYPEADRSPGGQAWQ